MRCRGLVGLGWKAKASYSKVSKKPFTRNRRSGTKMLEMVIKHIPEDSINPACKCCLFIKGFSSCLKDAEILLPVWSPHGLIEGKRNQIYAWLLALLPRVITSNGCRNIPLRLYGELEKYWPSEGLRDNQLSWSFLRKTVFTQDMSSCHAWRIFGNDALPLGCSRTSERMICWCKCHAGKCGLFRKRHTWLIWWPRYNACNSHEAANGAFVIRAVR